MHIHGVLAATEHFHHLQVVLFIFLQGDHMCQGISIKATKHRKKVESSFEKVKNSESMAAFFQIPCMCTIVQQNKLKNKEETQPGTNHGDINFTF